MVYEMLFDDRYGTTASNVLRFIPKEFANQPLGLCFKMYNVDFLAYMDSMDKRYELVDIYSGSNIYNYNRTIQIWEHSASYFSGNWYEFYFGTPGYTEKIVVDLMSNKLRPILFAGCLLSSATQTTHEGSFIIFKYISGCDSATPIICGLKSPHAKAELGEGYELTCNGSGAPSSRLLGS